ncbi:hypothetical protein OH77DRAFT_1430688 [Trametes cingulata]|nr:hypothetical protein OH77DRAFT_1430688 [Trametes cingulata]
MPSFLCHTVLHISAMQGVTANLEIVLQLLHWVQSPLELTQHVLRSVSSPSGAVRISAARRGRAGGQRTVRSQESDVRRVNLAAVGRGRDYRHVAGGGAHAIISRQRRGLRFPSLHLARFLLHPTLMSNKDYYGGGGQQQYYPPAGPPPGQGGYYPQQPQAAYQGGYQQPYGQPQYGQPYQPQPPPQTVYVCVRVACGLWRR